MSVTPTSSPTPAAAPLIGSANASSSITSLTRGGSAADYLDFLRVGAPLNGREVSVTVGLAHGRKGYGIPMTFTPNLPGSGPNDIHTLSETGSQVVTDLVGALNAAAAEGVLRPLAPGQKPSAAEGVIELSFASTNRERNNGHHPSFYDTSASTYVYDLNSRSQAARQVSQGIIDLLR